MFSKRLYAEIEAVTEEAVANAPLNKETDGVPLKELLTDPFVRKLATLYYIEEDRRICEDGIADPEERGPVETHEEFMQQRRVSVLGDLLDLELECRYGMHISDDERQAGTILEIRTGWRVFKVLPDIPVSELEQMLEESGSASMVKGSNSVN